MGPNLVRDGSFEEPAVVGVDYRVLSAGGTIGPWVVVSGTIDFIACGFWQAGEGCQSVDLNSCEAASIQQMVGTKKGGRYALCFSLAGNPEASPRLKKVEVWWDGSRIDTIDFDIAKSTRARMGWSHHSYAVTASSDFSQLMFRSLTPGCYGPVLDDVVLRELRLQVAMAPGESSPTP